MCPSPASRRYFPASPRRPASASAPQPGDAAGDFDFWFDGGACKHHTGSAHYEFADGTVAIVASPASWLWVRIAFGNGKQVSVLQNQSQP